MDNTIVFYSPFYKVIFKGTVVKQTPKGFIVEYKHTIDQRVGPIKIVSFVHEKFVKS